MNIKYSKCEIVTEKSIFDQTIEHPIDVDFSLPEYLPEISRILKCTANPMVLSKSVSGAAVSIEGDVAINLLYSDNTGNVSSFEYVIPFSKIIELPQTNVGYVKVALKTNYLNYRPTGKRRMDIHGAIGIIICAKNNEGFPMVSDIEGKYVETLKEEIELTSSCGYFEKNLIIDEELNISDDAPITHIIRYKATSNIDDAKIISGKIIVKGNLDLHILYSSEKVRKYKIYDTSIPYSQIIDAPGINDDYSVETDVNISALELKPRTNLSGDVTSLTVEGKLCVTADVYCDEKFEIVTDAFSTFCECDQNFDNVSYSKLCEISEDRFICKKNLEFSDGGLSEILDIWCDIQTGIAKPDNEGFLINGTITICILGIDSDETAVYYEKPLDFSYPCKIENTDSVSKISPNIKISNCSYTMQSKDKVEVRVELKTLCKAFMEKSISAVSDIHFNEENLKDNKRSFALVVYYSSNEEKIWSIAKRYNTSVESIKKANNLKCEHINEGQMILIPCI